MKKMSEWDSLFWPEFVVGDATKHDFVHPGDKTAHKFKNRVFYNTISFVGSNGVLYFGNSLYPIGKKVKILCLHKK